jgi:hypothetical protein
MDWKEIVSKMRLADIKVDLESDQVGIVNVKVENKTYNFNFYNPESVKAFMDAPKTPELEEAIKEKVVIRLSGVTPTPELLSGSTRQEIVAASTATASLDVASDWAISALKKKT